PRSDLWDLRLVLLAPFGAASQGSLVLSAAPSWRVLCCQVGPVLFPHQSNPREHGHPCIHVPQRVGKLVSRFLLSLLFVGHLPFCLLRPDVWAAMGADGV